MLSKIKPQKGKDYNNLPKKILQCFDDTEYIVSTKYDGNQIFIIKEDTSVRFFTSDWKQFDLPLIANNLENIPADFMLVGEFIYDCEGKLGSRGKSAILTTFRTNFAKGIVNVGTGQTKCMVKVFDCISIHNGKLITDIPYVDRLLNVSMLTESSKYLEIVDHGFMTGKQAKVFVKDMIALGWEGVMLVEPSSLYNIGKRVNHSIKLKERPTADLMCIDIIEGEGKYEGMIGSLVLIDSASRLVSVGSGLSDSDRCNLPSDYIGKVIEIQYEQILDTYIQPTFVSIRDDKIKGQ